MMAKEYKKRGGDYNTPKETKDESQKNLDKWGKEEWQTKEGSGQAKQEDGSRKRYLPKKAWDQMNEKEKAETDDKKQGEGKTGQQFVANTDKARKARKNARATEDEEEKSEDDDAEGSSEDSSGNDEPTPNTKRGRQAKDDGGKEQKKRKTDTKNNKKNDTVGSKHDKADAPAQQGSKDRLPKKGHKDVHWKALPGWVHGEVVEIVKSSKSVDGKQVKASKDDPRIVLKSKSGKICVHKPDNVYFD